jgi:hypothetical protein
VYPVTPVYPVGPVLIGPVYPVCPVIPVYPVYPVYPVHPVNPIPGTHIHSNPLYCKVDPSVISVMSPIRLPCSLSALKIGNSAVLKIAVGCITVFLTEKDDVVR